MDLITLAMAKKYSDSKGGYTETAVIFPKTELELEFVEETGLFNGVFDGVPFVPASGHRYEVVWNGVEYGCFATEVVMGDEEVHYIGNGSFIGLDDTGEPFIIAYLANNGEEILVCNTSDSTATVSISTETIVPINPKYLPGVCLPVVDVPFELLLQAQQSGTAENLPSEIVESLKKAFESQSPLYVVFDAGEYAPYPNAYFSAIAYGTPYSLNMDNGQVPSFEFLVSGVVARFFQGLNGTWTLMVET